MPMPKLVLLDVNGTLTDLRPIGAHWERPELGTAVLEGAVQTAMVDALLGTGHRSFSDHLRSALEVLVANAGLDPDRIDTALATAGELPSWPDARNALELLAGSDLRLVALTNSGAEAGTKTLRACGLLDLVERVLGVDAVSSFKPHPSVYTYALDELGCAASEVALLATHPWDLAGAAHAGITAAWVTHGAHGWPSVFPTPDIKGENLLQVAGAIVQSSAPA